MKGIRVHQFGGPEVMSWEDIPIRRPGPGEVLVRSKAIGVNFIDVYYRQGSYQAALPMTLGAEGAGVVQAVERARRERLWEIESPTQ